LNKTPEGDIVNLSFFNGKDGKAMSAGGYNSNYQSIISKSNDKTSVTKSTKNILEDTHVEENLRDGVENV